MQPERESARPQDEIIVLTRQRLHVCATVGLTHTSLSLLSAYQKANAGVLRRGLPHPMPNPPLTWALYATHSPHQRSTHGRLGLLQHHPCRAGLLRGRRGSASAPGSRPTSLVCMRVCRASWPHALVVLLLAAAVPLMYSAARAVAHYHYPGPSRAAAAVAGAPPHARAHARAAGQHTTMRAALSYPPPIVIPPKSGTHKSTMIMVGVAIDRLSGAERVGGGGVGWVGVGGWGRGLGGRATGGFRPASPP